MPKATKSRIKISQLDNECKLLVFISLVLAMFLFALIFFGFYGRTLSCSTWLDMVASRRYLSSQNSKQINNYTQNNNSNPAGSSFGPALGSKPVTWDTISLAEITPSDPLEKLQILAENNNNPGVSGFVPSPNLTSGFFGDLFSSPAWLNQDATTLFLDENTTALTFPPVFNFNRGGVASGGAVEPARLVVRDNVLYFDDQQLTLPPELQGENILTINVHKLTTKWVVGFVTGRDYDENGFVYFYDGNNFYPLITKTTPGTIAPQYRRLGGSIYFGGTDDDFLILYSGYDGRAFYYHSGALTNVSSFFGLRVTSEGFSAKILRTENSRGSVFYVCSDTAGKPKFIKVWSRQVGELMGSLDFSPSLFKNGLESAQASCFPLNDTNPPQVVMALTVGRVTENFTFVDRGFDNSQAREVVSANLNNAEFGSANGKKILIKAAKIWELELKAGDLNDFKFYFSSQPDGGSLGWQEADLYSWLEIVSPTSGIYWRAVFQNKPGDTDYSPWFNTLNNLEYKIDFVP
jgi:hypothetical protein